MSSKKSNSLGKCIIKDHYKRTKPVVNGVSRHTTDLHDGYDWGRLNLRSVTEQSSLDDFLEKAQLAGKEYTSECQNVSIITPDVACGMVSKAEADAITVAQGEYKHLLQIPRRPVWNETTTKEELLMKENDEFLQWRRNLALLREKEHISLTPYEKNLEVWKQLWRVIERSDIIMQIIDARNPFLFRCEDLELYVKDVDETKLNVLLLNKSDFLSEVQRKLWADYFLSIGVKAIFFSALQQMQETEVADSDEHSNELVSRDELIELLKKLGRSTRDCPQINVGLVGYPNVGKSSTINAIFCGKKVSVSATPGKTKHFQTLVFDDELCFCDCPGLVFPNFVSSKAEMVINGILPIDQLTNHIPPVTLVASLIPRHILQQTYAIMLPAPGEDKDPASPPSAEELLNSHGYMRGFMTQRGLPDNARSARYILKDFVNGKLLYCHAPPGMDQEEYHKFKHTLVGSTKPKFSGQSVIYAKSCDGKISKLDRETFMQSSINKEILGSNSDSFSVHTKGMIGIRGYISTRNLVLTSDEPGKPSKKHYNRNRKEKTRRIENRKKKIIAAAMEKQ